MKYILIDPDPTPLQPGTPNQRFEGFQEAIPNFETSYIHFSEIPKYITLILESERLIISGSKLNIIGEDGKVDQKVITQLGELQNVLESYPNPVLGICFGMQFLAYLSGVGLRAIPPPNSEEEWGKTGQIRIDKDLLALGLHQGEEIEVEWNHHQEIHPQETRGRVEIFGSTEVCKFQIVKFREHEWYGVQFHPETMKLSKNNAGKKILQSFLKL